MVSSLRENQEETTLMQNSQGAPVLICDEHSLLLCRLEQKIVSLRTLQFNDT